jgi:DUF1680 family protein
MFIAAMATSASPAMAEEREDAAMVLKTFDLARVRLLDGPCKTAQEADRHYLHELDADRLLHAFRQNANLPAPGPPLGGWEAPTCEVRGHFIGHYLTACALMYASTGDEGLKAKADAMVGELGRCQQALGGGYLSAYPESFWDRLESMQGPPWAPYYVIHKIMAGMLDVHELCGNAQALDVVKGMASYFKKRIDKLSIYKWDQILGVEFGGMAEVLYNLYAITNDPDHRDLAHKFDKAAFLGPLALQHDPLSRIHANTHIPEIVGAARRYELLGDAPYRTAVEFFWDRVVNARMYATGGTSNSEHWPDPNALANTLSHQNQESCTSYNMLRVTRHLICWNPDPRYADYYERTYFNSILGTQNPETGMLTYFTPLASGNVKTFGTPCDSFWCCYGTGIESFAKLGDSIYFHNDKDLYVNLFVASEVDWRERGARIEQQTRFPEEEGTTLVVHAPRAAKFALNIHVPYWAANGVKVAVNGKQIDAEAAPSSYLRIDGPWHDNDRIEVRMPMSLHVHPMPDNANLVAAMYGPLVLAGLSTEKRYFLGDASNVDTWLRKTDDKPLAFRTTGQAADADFIPLNRVIDETYGVYWEVVKGGSGRHRELIAEEKVRRRLEARVVDRVTPGNEAVEKSHGLKGENTQSGAHMGRNWRHATAGGWWSWAMKVLPDQPMTLRCAYWGDDVPPRTFDILIDDRVIAAQSLDRNKPGAFFEIDYPIPPNATEGKETVTVKFLPHKGNMAGGVFECLVFKPEDPSK